MALKLPFPLPCHHKRPMQRTFVSSNSEAALRARPNPTIHQLSPPGLTSPEPPLPSPSCYGCNAHPEGHWGPLFTSLSKTSIAASFALPLSCLSCKRGAGTSAICVPSRGGPAPLPPRGKVGAEQPPELAQLPMKPESPCRAGPKLSSLSLHSTGQAGGRGTPGDL